MVEEVAKNIYRIGVPLPNNPLKELNSYFIRGDDRDVLIDTGFRCAECRIVLESGLAELHSDPTRRDVLVTHLHSDHAGMADLFAGPGRHIFMGKVDLQRERDRSFSSADGYKALKGRFKQEGFPAELLEYVQHHNPARIMMIPKITENFRELQDGMILHVGEYHLRTISVPGHTPGNVMFWSEEQGIMFSGDHILFDITPNITLWDGVEDALGDYLESLRRVRNLPVKQTLPGHRTSGSYQDRIDALLHHHELRLQEVMNVIAAQPGLTAYDIAAQMTWHIRARNWEEFPSVQKWFAVGECLSHLDYLCKRKKLHRKQIDNIWRYSLTSRAFG